jgi:hypothetical protein
MTEVHGTIEWAKDKLEAFPKAKKELGPLLDALSRKFALVIVVDNISSDFFRLQEPLTQIVGGVMLLLAGVLNLVGKLVSYASPTKNQRDFNFYVQLSGLGLDGLLKGIIAATVSDGCSSLLVYTHRCRFTGS